jgi:D-beta-D-heptose 7-phosphate kinase/D-beta-D-heptose 1-phosphate adenosyltransferase
MALRSVDCVCIFSEDTPFELIGLLRPDVLVKGAEYSVDKIVGADLLASWGGAVRRVRMKKGYSTSRVIRRASLRKRL